MTSAARTQPVTYSQPMRFAAEGIFRRNQWGRGRAACRRPNRGRRVGTPRGAGAGSRAARRAGPKDREAPLTRRRSAVGAAG